MKGLMYRGPRDIRHEDMPDPSLPDSHSAIVRTTLCSICGSDLHPYHVDLGVRDFCIGHEAVGEVVEIGPDVANFRIGDRVLVHASIGCGRCRQCLAGHVVLCENTRGIRAYGQGNRNVPGCQAEAIPIAAADNNLFRLPDDFSDELGIMLSDNMATAWYCARRGRVEPGDSVAVIGLGSVGLQAVMAARAMGAERIFAIDLLADRRQAARKLGAEPVDETDVGSAVMERTGGRGVDVVLDCSGGRITTALAVGMVRKGGRISQVGVSEQAEIAFPILQALGRSIEFRTGVCSVQAEVPHLVTALRSGRLKAAEVEGIVTHRMKLSEGAEAYRLFDERPAGLQKIVLDPAN